MSKMWVALMVVFGVCSAQIIEDDTLLRFEVEPDGGMIFERKSFGPWSGSGRMNDQGFGSRSPIIQSFSRHVGHQIAKPSTNSISTRESQRMDREEYKIVCYVESWAHKRKEPFDFTPHNVPAHGCSHLLYAYAYLNETDLTIEPMDQDYDINKGGYKRAIALKKKNPKLKVMISFGGVEDSGIKYSKMIATKESRAKFVKSVISFLKEHKFDGLDLAWQYPGGSDIGGKESDKKNFLQLAKGLWTAFKAHDWILSATVPAIDFRVDAGYEVTELSSCLDFLSVTTFDLRGYWDGRVDHHAPLKEQPHDYSLYENFNIEDAMDYWVQQGAPKHKLILGIPFYARTYLLESPEENKPGSLAKSGGQRGPYTEETGLLAYFEVCQKFGNKSWTMGRTEKGYPGYPYMYMGRQWIGYMDTTYVDTLTMTIRVKGFGGAMVFALDLDDYASVCGKKYPLLTTVTAGLSGTYFKKPSVKQSTKRVEMKPASSALQSEKSTDKKEGSKASAVQAPGQLFCSASGYFRLKCNVYMVCSADKMGETVHCPEGLVFDLDTLMCVPREMVKDCLPGYRPLQKNNAECTSDGLFNDPKDCSKYVWCKGGKKTVSVCPHGLQFDPVGGRCVADEDKCISTETVQVHFA